MHELALIESMVATVEAKVRPARVGALCARSTVLDRARLQIDEVGGRGCCRRCGGHVAMETVSERRPYSREIDVTRGREPRIATLELQ
jgi:Zn finger protein HypA/HybF involved in hydrogenase expression